MSDIILFACHILLLTTEKENRAKEAKPERVQLNRNQTNKKIVVTSSKLSVFTGQHFFLKSLCYIKETTSEYSCTALMYFKTEYITQAKTNLVKLSVHNLKNASFAVQKDNH